MTVFAKDTTYGLETVIKDCQEYLDSELSSLWDGTIEVYGLIEKTQEDNKIFPEAWIGTGIGNKEYDRVFINDKVACTIGFQANDRSLIPYKSANVDIIFTLKLPAIYPSSTTRDKEKALLQAENILEEFGGIGEVNSIQENIIDVFSGFDIDSIMYRDMHPWYVFSFNIDLDYIDNPCQ